MPAELAHEGKHLRSAEEVTESSTRDSSASKSQLSDDDELISIVSFAITNPSFTTFESEPSYKSVFHNHKPPITLVA